MRAHSISLIAALYLALIPTSILVQSQSLCTSPNGKYNGDTKTCACNSGYTGSQCQMCVDDSACQRDLNSPRAQCTKSVSYSRIPSPKNYACTLDSTIQDLVSANAAVMRCNPEQKICVLQLEQDKQRSSTPVLQCNLTTCSFQSDSPSFTCNMINCKCPSETCTGILSLALGFLNGNSLEVSSKGSNISIDIKNAPFPINAPCQFSTCELPTIISVRHEQTLEGWMIALIVLACLVVLIAACILYFKLCSKRSAPRKTIKCLFPLTDGPKQFSFNDISCYSITTSSLFGSNIPEKRILEKISGSTHANEILALLGPSGAGKSSLLNILANVSNGNCKSSGTVLIDGKDRDRNYREIAAYVPQEDTLYSTLTVKECIQYSAQLRLSFLYSKEQIIELVQEILHALNLDAVADSRIGSSGTSRGISGGERRRLSIGMELVISPQIVFLDEPTSGLDSSSANTIVQLIRTLADQGRMVILSIHQPSCTALQAIDRIMLLSEGKLLYNGPTSSATAYFEMRGYPFPEYGNVAEYLLDIASTGHTSANAISVDTRANSELSHALLASEPDRIPDVEYARTRDLSTKNERVKRSFVTELQVLTWRASLHLFRHRSLIQLHLLLSLLLALFCGFIFNSVSDDLAGFQNRSGAFFFTLTFFGFSSLSSTDSFISERVIATREIGAMYYSSFGYFFTKAALDALFIRVIPATLFASIFYFMMGLRAGATHFLLFVYTIVTFNVAAGALTIFLGVSARSVGAANLIGIVILLLMFLFGGLFLNSYTAPNAIAWIRYLSIFKYAFETMMTNELMGIALSLDAPGYPKIPIQGQVFLKTLELDVEYRYWNVVVLLLFAFLFYLVGYLSLFAQVGKIRRVLRRRCEDKDNV